MDAALQDCFAKLVELNKVWAGVQISFSEQIKDFRILPKALDPEQEGEPVTPTRKVKRHLMYQHFQALVEEMYDDREQRLIAGSTGAMPAA